MHKLVGRQAKHLLTEQDERDRIAAVFTFPSGYVVGSACNCLMRLAASEGA